MSILGPMLVAGNAMEMFSNAMQITGDNIANLNTVSFRSSRFSFDDVMPTVWGEIETGNGARLADVGKPFQQGALETTNGALDLAISGNGFFVVRDPLSNTLRYTRAGEFHLDGAGQMVNPGGQILQGAAGDIVINSCAHDPGAGHRQSRHATQSRCVIDYPEYAISRRARCQSRPMDRGEQFLHGGDDLR